MLRFLINAISRASGFSKTESRGTLLLIFIMFLMLAVTRFSIHSMKNASELKVDSNDSLWLEQVKASIELKKEEAATRFDKTVYLPKKMVAKSPKTPTHKYISAPETKPSVPAVILDLNNASASDLRTVKGIGKVYSERIVKYRDLLGGYVHMDQLREVYGLKEETIDAIAKSFAVQSKPSGIDLSSDSIKVLAKHPYISYDLARIIINYQKQHGSISSSEELKK